MGLRGDIINIFAYICYIWLQIRCWEGCQSGNKKHRLLWEPKTVNMPHKQTQAEKVETTHSVYIYIYIYWLFMSSCFMLSICVSDVSLYFSWYRWYLSVTSNVETMGIWPRNNRCNLELVEIMGAHLRALSIPPSMFVDEFKIHGGLESYIMLQKLSVYTIYIYKYMYIYTHKYIYIYISYTHSS